MGSPGAGKLDRNGSIAQLSPMNEPASPNQPPAGDDFGTLVFDETIRRALRKTPQERLEMLRASLRDAEARGMIPTRNRAEHEKRLLWLIQHASSKS